MLGRFLHRCDDAIAAFERGLIVVLMAVMASAVFLDAVHRLFAADEGRVERLMIAALPSSWHGSVRTLFAPLVLGLATAGVCYGAVRTRTGPTASRRRAAALALLLSAALTGATQLLVRGLPHGLVWSQQMALALLLIVALAGASLGAREHAHVTFELAGQLGPRRLRRPAELVARTIAAGFSLFLSLLAALHAREHYREWSSSDGAAGLFEAFAAPRWVIFGFLPLPLAAMGVRFALHGVRARAPSPTPAEPGA